MFYVLTGLVALIVFGVVALTVVFAVLDDLAKSFDEDWTR